MKTEGAFTILTDEKDQILLAKRRDYPIWDLPGGRVETNETPTDCAIREVEEETGYQIEISEKIGVYDRPDKNDSQHIYLGRIVGGFPIQQNDETKGLRFFAIKKLPLLMVPHRRRQINDYVNGDRNKSETLSDASLLCSMLKSK